MASDLDPIDRLQALLIAAMGFDVLPAARLDLAQQAIATLGQLGPELERLRHIEACAQRLAEIKDDPGELLYREEEDLFQALKAPAPSALVVALRRATQGTVAAFERSMGWAPIPRGGHRPATAACAPCSGSCFGQWPPDESGPCEAAPRP
jgi:hypothetical protein